MKPYYKRIDVKEKTEIINWISQLEEILEKIDLDFATYIVEDLGINYLKIFINNGNRSKPFTSDEEYKIKRALEKAFTFQNKPIPEDTNELEYNRYMWVKKLRENEGTCMWIRVIQNPFTNKSYHELVLMIENADIGKCTLVKKEVLRTVYAMDCGGGKSENQN